MPISSLRSRLGGPATAALLLAGCTQHAHSSPPSTHSSPPGRGHVTVISMPWTLAGVQGATIRVRWIAGGCLTLDRAQARETQRTVTIALLAFKYVSGPGEACPADAFLATTTLRLRRPLRARRIVHAPAR